MLTHASHAHTRTETANAYPDGSVGHTLEEVVEATFRVEGLEDFQYGRTDTRRRASYVRVIFHSAGGDDWKLDAYHSVAEANNVRQNGTVGALVNVSWFDFPQALKQAVETETAAWVNETYPRAALPLVDLAPRQLVTLLGHQVRQAHTEFDEDGTAANARELAAKLLAYADAVDAN